MTYDKIKERVAELRGYKRMYGLMDKASTQEHEYWITPDGLKTVILPNYPANILDAWELIEEIESAPETMTLFSIVHQGSDITPNKLIWHAKFRNCWKDFKEYIAEADTAPLAICHAFIQWKKCQK